MLYTERGERMGQVQLSTLAAEARAAIDNEEYERAAHACRRALSRYPRWVDGYWMLGTILVERDYPQEAQACFEAVASATPDDPRPYEGLAAVAEHLDELPVAAAGLFRAIEVGEPSAAVRHELQRLLQQLGRPADIVTTHARLAHAHLQSGQYEAADLSAEKALQEEPERLDMLLVQAAARLLGHDKRSALGRCEALLELSPDCLKALAMTRLLVADTDKIRAAQIDEDLAALDPEQHVLVWLHQQLSGRGFDVSSLPSAAKTITWVEDEAVPAAPVAQPGSLLERLIPDLERAMPQWLRDISTEQQGEPVSPPSSTTPPAATSTTRAALTGSDETPSFLGDVDALAQEFHEAMKSSTGGGAGSSAEAAPPMATSTPAEPAPAADWTRPALGEPDSASPATEEAQTRAAERPATVWEFPTTAQPTEEAPASAAAAEFTTALTGAESSPKPQDEWPVDAAAEPETTDTAPSWLQEEQQLPEAAPVVAEAAKEQPPVESLQAPQAVTVEQPAAGTETAWPAAEAPARQSDQEAWPVPAAEPEEHRQTEAVAAVAESAAAPEPAATGKGTTQVRPAPEESEARSAGELAYDPRDAEQAWRAGDAAARAGDYWQAVRAYGDALAALRR